MNSRKKPDIDNNLASLGFDAKDRQILQRLQANARISNADLAKAVHLSPSATLRRVKALEDSGIVSGSAVILDDAQVGFSGTAFVSVALDQQGRAALDRFEAAIKPVAQVLECWLLAGQSDYLLRVVYRDAQDLERLHSEIITQLPGVVRVNSTITLRAVKRTTSLPL